MSENFESIYRRAANGNAEAFNWLISWSIYVHGIDDLIDEPNSDYERFLAALALGNCLYSNQFYQRNVVALWSVVRLVTNNYADSLIMVDAAEPWKKQWGDALRFAGNEMAVAVAGLPECGGYSNMRKVSMALREDSWKEHHLEGQQV